jgi:hypothetical protein
LAVAALAAAALNPTVAYADGDPPPAEPTEEPAPPPEEPQEDPEAAPTNEEEGAEETEELGDGEVEEADPTTPILSTDPFFTYLGDTYRFAEASDYCTINFTGDPNCFQGLPNPIQAAINWLSSNDAAPDNSTVYVEDGFYTNDDVVINGGAWTTTTPTQLNLQSLNGSGVTTIDGSVTISLMENFILQGFTLTGMIDSNNNQGTLTITDVVVDGTGGTGVAIGAHDGDVMLDSVQSNNNDGSGATIDNTAGTGDVTITNSTFNDNNVVAASGMQVGLSVDSNGTVLLENVQANGNLDGDGAVIVGDTITVLGSTFNGNISPTTGYGQGLVVWSNGGDILVSGTTASGNTENGMVLIHTSPDPANLITVQFSKVSGNGDFGLLAMPQSGTVVLECVCGSGNGLGTIMVPAGQTVETYPCPPTEHEGKHKFVGTLLSEEFPKYVNAGNGVLVTFPIIEILNPDELAIGKVWALLEKQLPLPIGEGEIFMAGVKIEIINAALIEDLEDGLIKIEFYIAAYLQDREYTVYWFDEEATEWLAIPHVFEEHSRFPGGKIVAEWDQTGIFILVMHEEVAP